MHDGHIMLTDGRTLAYTDVGDPAGQPVVHFHGSPSSRREPYAFETAFADAGVRMITYDRPGYGVSSPSPGRSLRDAPRDAAALADALGIDRFVVSGLSGGAPFAMACRALLPDRTAAVCLVAGDPDLAWPGARDGYAPLELAIIDAVDDDAAVAVCEGAIGADGSAFFASDGMRWAEPDLAMLADDSFAAHVQAVIAEGFRQGIAGYVRDVRAKGQPWPEIPHDRTVPVTIVHGDRDTIVPLDHARLVAQHVDGATLRVLPGHGHLSILGEWPGVLAEVVRRAT